ncbi:MAG: LicD family protein [Prevotellaceae bacterium]|nr:LicD family protein [Prevotellaceae bacterium]
MRQITDVKELRSLQIAILDSIVGFCNANGINYSLAGGTLIGAVRHKGYIPWDDDIDLYMLREDYERFVRAYSDKGGRYEVMYPEKNKDYLYTFAKVVDNDTLMIEDEAPDFRIGVYVDIFPVDYTPDDIDERKRLYKLKYLLYKIRRCKMSKTNYLSSRLAFLFYKYLPIPLSLINALNNKYILKRKPSATLCDMTNPGLPPKAVFPVEAMKSFVDVTFEGKTYKAMAGYHTYMSNLYGDYMKIPPVEQRIQHHFKAYVK